MTQAIAVQRGARQATRPARATTIRLERKPTAPQAKATASNYEDAFRLAYETHYTKIFAFVYSRVRETELARDIVSEVFEKAYVNGNTVRDAGAYSAWLFMIAKNSISAHFRKNTREMRHMDRAKNELHFVDGPPEPEDILLRSERIQQLMRHVRTLPARDQELISLKFDAELTHEEISRIMKMTSLNVRVSIFRALKKLKARMQAEMAA